VRNKGIVTAIRAYGFPDGSLAKRMKKISYRGYRFPPEIIQRAIWLYLRFALSFRDVEDLLAEHGITVFYETVRHWVSHFGPLIGDSSNHSGIRVTGSNRVDRYAARCAFENERLGKANDASLGGSIVGLTKLA